MRDKRISDIVPLRSHASTGIQAETAFLSIMSYWKGAHLDPFPVLSICVTHPICNMFYFFLNLVTELSCSFLSFRLDKEHRLHKEIMKEKII